MEPLLRVEGLCTVFHTDRGLVHAVNDVSYDVCEGEIIGLVGESGCGKSVSQMSLLQLIPTPPGRITAGKALFEGRDILSLGKYSAELAGIRGERISMVFQEPMTSLNPAITIAKQMTEVLTLHLKTSPAEARERCADMLAQVGIPDAARRMDDYPHRLSGGMRQRVMVGMAMLCNPKMIIADEATTALDATIQAQLLELMYAMVQKYRTALVLVTHNLGVVARYAHRVNVMYAGRIVETGTTDEIWKETAHPYTKGLLRCVPRLGEKLVPIQGKPPSLIGMSELCPFRPRCPEKTALCDGVPIGRPVFIGGKHSVACVKVTGGKEA
jgi:oligopeptide/dipeptide ABC transporter ATP-binding protein